MFRIVAAVSVLLLSLTSCVQQGSQRGNVLVSNTLNQGEASVDIYIDHSKQASLDFKSGDYSPPTGYGPQVGQQFCLQLTSGGTAQALRVTITKAYPYTYGFRIIGTDSGAVLESDSPTEAAANCG